MFRRVLNASSIQTNYADLADVLVVEPRLVRRAIKEHLLETQRFVTGVVPHARLQVLERSDLGRLLQEDALSQDLSGLHERVLLISRPAGAEQDGPAFESAVGRAALHGAIHLLLDERVRAGRLSAAEVRRRIDQLGRAEFEEVRAILDHDDLLVPPGHDLDVYVEFAALFVELYFFRPELLVTTFPGIIDPEAALSVLRQDLDIDDLSRRATVGTSPSRFSERPTVPRSSRPAPSVSKRSAARLLRRAARLKTRGRDALAILLCTRASLTQDQKLRREAEWALEAHLQGLARRLSLTLELDDPRESENTWLEALRSLADAGAQSESPKKSSAFGTLRSLERACEALEQPGFLVDVPSWILSGGSRPIVRPREATRTLTVARHIEAARNRVERVEQSKARKQKTISVLTRAREESYEMVRSALRPRIERTLVRVGLRPTSGPERQARDNLVAELLDQVLDRGFVSISQLRDAISRNELKLSDMSSLSELTGGDALLLADRRLSEELDGIYRRGDIYVRWLQKLSSLPFGTKSGRVISLWLVLPALGAFTVVEGLRHVVGPVFEWLGAGTWRFNWIAFASTALFLLGLLHSEWVRVASRVLLEWLGALLSLLFVKLPRALLGGVLLQRLFGRAGFRTFVRVGLLPAGVAAVTYLATPKSAGSPLLRWTFTAGTFAVVAVTMGSRMGFFLEEFYLQQVAPAWSAFSRQLLPSLLRAIGRTFAVAMDALDRASHQIGDALRFRATDSPIGVFVAGAAGLLWAIVAYVLRLYVTLLVEPEINPLKHFPVVTVAHKIMLPFLPDLLLIIERPLSILPPLLGGAIAGVTVFLLPSVFGFLAWEFKENYRLYRSTRSEFIQPVRFGPGGETFRELLVEGLHSGTVPKVYDRLRRAARREAESSRSGQPVSLRSPNTSSETGRFHQRLRQIEVALLHFVERQLLPPLRAFSSSALGDLELHRVEISFNRIRLRLKSESHADAGPLEITIEQLGGLLVASLSRRGFVDVLTEEKRLLFENVLAVFYHRAHIDIVREQLQEELGIMVDYDILEEGLIVRGAGAEGDLVYDLNPRLVRDLKPRCIGPKPETTPKIRSDRLLFRQQRVSFSDWEEAWRASMTEGAPERLTKGASLLGQSLFRN